jgi:hypothetical protein
MILGKCDEMILQKKYSVIWEKEFAISPHWVFPIAALLAATPNRLNSGLIN